VRIPAVGLRKDACVTKVAAAVSKGIPLPIEIIGCDLDGKGFIERSETLTVHRGGASFLLSNKLAPESELIIRNPSTNEEALARVVGQIGENGAGHVYGVAFVDPWADLWHINFITGASETVVRLECSRCRCVSALPVTQIEVEVLEARQGLTRQCESCRSSTVWKKTNREPTEKKNGRQLKPTGPAAAVPSVSTSEERRKNRRTVIKASACLLYSGIEEIAECEDVSRGGFRFTSRRRYPAGTRLEAAVPYTKAGNNIFSLACIVHCQQLENGSYRHGAAYQKASASRDWKP
jgi:PilZ domain